MLTGVVGVVRTGGVIVIVIVRTGVGAVIGVEIVMAGGAEELAVLGHEGRIHGGKQ